MNVLVVGATVAIGRPLISALVSAGHNVFWDEILPLRQDGSNGSPEQKPQAGHAPGGPGLTEKAKVARPLDHSSILGCRVVRSGFWMTGNPEVISSLVEALATAGENRLEEVAGRIGGASFQMD